MDTEVFAAYEGSCLVLKNSAAGYGTNSEIPKDFFLFSYLPLLVNIVSKPTGKMWFIS